MDLFENVFRDEYHKIKCQYPLMDVGLHIFFVASIDYFPVLTVDGKVVGIQLYLS